MRKKVVFKNQSSLEFESKAGAAFVLTLYLSSSQALLKPCQKGKLRRSICLPGLTHWADLGKDSQQLFSTIYNPSYILSYIFMYIIQEIYIHRDNLYVVDFQR